MGHMGDSQIGSYPRVNGLKPAKRHSFSADNAASFHFETYPLISISQRWISILYRKFINILSKIYYNVTYNLTSVGGMR